MDLKGVIREQRLELENIQRTEHIIQREGLAEAGEYLRYPNILVVTGVRRCGKSIFSYLLEKGHRFGYVNFDDERLFSMDSGRLDAVLQAFHELYGDIDCVVLDEIQNVKGWELFANRLRRSKRVVLTGSNSTMLSSELATHLTGRYADIRLFPFSFREYLDFRGVLLHESFTTQEKASVMKHLQDYLADGGMPEVYKFGKSTLMRTYDDILTKDVVVRHGVKKSEDLKKMARYLASSVSEEMTYRSLAKTLGIKHVSTISKWMSYLEECFLFFRLERFDYKLKKQFLAPKKAYCIDTGIVDSIGFRFSENRGKVLENAVALELQRRKERDRRLEVYYWKDYSQKEVDFVLKRGAKVSELIQVTAISSMDEFREREAEALVAASVKLRCDSLVIITMDLEAEMERGGRKIRLVPAWKWLLDRSKREGGT